MKLTGKHYTAELEQGIVKGFYRGKNENNLVDCRGNFGRVCYTYQSDDITKIPYEELTGYKDRLCEYDKYENAAFIDSKNQIETVYELLDEGLMIRSRTENEEISQFGLQLDFNFISKKGTDYREQYSPTTFYTSEDGAYQYSIMISPKGSCIVVIAKTPCDGWKLDYSPFCGGHFIMGMKFLASFDKQFGGSGRKEIAVKIQCTDSVEEAFDLIQKEYGVPMLFNVVSGGFQKQGILTQRGEADCYRIQLPSGKSVISPVKEIIPMEEYGIYTITPQKDGKDGLGTSLYYGKELETTFTRACDAIKVFLTSNLCEGGCYLWAILVYMNAFQNDRYKAIADKMIPIVMGEGEPKTGFSIVPYETDTHPAYHLHHSDRIQGQFFGISILLEAYKYYKDQKYLEFAINALNELLDHHFDNGQIIARGYYHDSDYTTVCAPVIAIVDLAMVLTEQNDPRAERYKEAAVLVAEHLYRRGYNFPTEGDHSDLVDREYEDGSISCTALSLLYVYYYIKQESKYLDFARDILKMHQAWTIYTPDVRQYQSSFRFWETDWEGDRLGPAICAGHAWTIWRAEALYYYGLICKDDNAVLDSYNGFVTNFSKIQKDGTTYSCFEPDYLKGGGWDVLRNELIEKENGADTSPRFMLGHSYPKHPDVSLPFYVWARAASTWMSEKIKLNISEEKVEIQYG